jgi:tetratricopeptide (TPR) repeat protein
MSEELQDLIERYKRAPDSRIFAPLADAYRKKGEVDKAIEIVEKGLEKFPQYASAHVILGKCFYDKGATERAKAEFTRVLDVDAENMVALKFMGEIFLAEDKRADAAEYFKKILVIDPTNEDVAHALEEMEESFVIREIDLGGEKPVRDEHPRELATMTLAGIYAAQGYYGKALKIYRDVLEREPGNREAQEMAGRLQSIMDSTEIERDKAFQGEVLSISLDDVSEDIVSSTAGRGGGSAAVRQDITPVPGIEHGEEGGAEGDAARPQERGESTRMPSAAESPRESASAPHEDSTEGDMEHFRSWLKRLKGK